MPLYEYECEACGHRLEIIQKYSEGPPDACPKCGRGPLQRLQSSPAIQFKGTGWYVTDYASKGKGGGSDAKSEGKSEPGKGDAPASSSGDSSSSGASEGKSSEGKSSETKKSDTPASTSTAPKD